MTSPPIVGAGAAEVEDLVRALSRSHIAPEKTVAFSKEQNDALNAVEKGENVFVTGVGGTGKSVLLREMRARLEARGKVVCIAAPTGLAAENIDGCTVHAAAGIGVSSDVHGFGYLTQLHRNRIQNYDVLMIDEVSMLAGEFIDRLSEHFSQARQNSRPFGGLQIVFFGDFLQLGPIDNTEERANDKGGFCPSLFLNRGWAFASWTWSELKFKYVELKKVFRQSDEAFVNVLRRIRLGDRNTADDLKVMLSELSEDPAMAAALQTSLDHSAARVAIAVGKSNGGEGFEALNAEEMDAAKAAGEDPAMAAAAQASLDHSTPVRDEPRLSIPISRGSRGCVVVAGCRRVAPRAGCGRTSDDLTKILPERRNSIGGTSRTTTNLVSTNREVDTLN
jgi:hypothetical protein